MILSKNSSLFLWSSDRVLLWVIKCCGVVAGTIVLFIFSFLLYESYPILGSRGGSIFFTDPSWHPSQSFYNLSAMISGTALVVLGAVFLAGPLGIASGIFCALYAPPWVANGYRQLLRIIAGIPSVVYGFWGLVVLVPMIARIHPPGPSLISGVLVLAIMILPTIALNADMAISSLPVDYMRGASALGISRWSMTRGILLPAACGGILTGIILGLGRAMGETMAILMVCGNVVQIPQHPFESVRTLASNMALEMAYAMDEHRSALFVSGLMLMSLILLLCSGAEWLTAKERRA